jgi:aspartate/methionine/tyrosine aminotransferase
VRLKSAQTAYDFSEELLVAKGVVTLPNSVYDFAGNHFRIGFGRKNMPEALAQMRAFIDARNA